MTISANRPRRLVVATLLGVTLAASCVEIEDASDTKKKATADSAAGAVGTTPAAVTPVPPSTARFGPDSATYIRGGPPWTPEEMAALQSDSAHSITEIDTTIVASDGAPNGAAVAAPGAPGTPSGVAVPTPLLAKGALLIPVQGIEASALRNTYDERRGGGSRTHEALDIPAQRGTPVLSATGGRVLKLFDSKAGGKMVYAADSSERFILMYAHLDTYANGLADGQPLRRGQVLGTVGTTGNAPPTVPHLHFAIARSNNVKEWWKGAPVNPYPLFAP
ncbi:MAG TPA: M23 family metallopeptidase [Gemmatimonadaceae bacterium]|nr:M23 family metallopeptidase [Gemmatimonadaceae bacterium]